VDVKREWQEFRRRAKFPDVRVHDIRRTHGSYMALGGASLPIIGDALGHAAGSDQTAIYARLNRDAQREARLVGERKMHALMDLASVRLKAAERGHKLLKAAASRASAQRWAD
jgi:hypothetical protein